MAVCSFLGVYTYLSGSLAFVGSLLFDLLNRMKRKKNELLELPGISPDTSKETESNRFQIQRTTLAPLSRFQTERGMRSSSFITGVKRKTLEAIKNQRGNMNHSRTGGSGGKKQRADVMKKKKI